MLAGQNIQQFHAQAETPFEPNQTCFRFSLDKVFHLLDFEAKLFFHAKLSGQFLQRLTLNYLVA